MFGGEIESYQKKAVPQFCYQLKRNIPDLYQQVVEIYPEIQNLIENINYVGKKAKVKTLLPGKVKLSSDILDWNGDMLKAMRKGEIQDKTYHFVSEEEFLDKLNSEFFLEHKKYETAEGEWYYGSAKEDYENGDNNSVIILTPSGFEALKVYIARQKVDIDIVSIYIYANNKTISNRLKKRGDKKEEADRRIKADSVDFKNVVDIVDKIFYNNETNDLDEVVKKVHEYIKYRNEDKN